MSLLGLLVAAAAAAIPPTPGQVTHVMHCTPRACCGPLHPFIPVLCLSQVAGTSGKVKLDGGSDDEGAACDAYGAAILAALGHERYCQVLSKLYLARSDVQYVVRNTALHM